jgi:hypothetical protein
MSPDHLNRMPGKGVLPAVIFSSSLNRIDQSAVDGVEAARTPALCWSSNWYPAALPAFWMADTKTCCLIFVVVSVCGSQSGGCFLLSRFGKGGSLYPCRRLTSFWMRFSASVEDGGGGWDWDWGCGSSEGMMGTALRCDTLLDSTRPYRPR